MQVFKDCKFIKTEVSCYCRIHIMRRTLNEFTVATVLVSVGKRDPDWVYGTVWPFLTLSTNNNTVQYNSSMRRKIKRPRLASQNEFNNGWSGGWGSGCAFVCVWPWTLSFITHNPGRPPPPRAPPPPHSTPSPHVHPQPALWSHDNMVGTETMTKLGVW